MESEADQKRRLQHSLAIQLPASSVCSVTGDSSSSQSPELSFPILTSEGSVDDLLRPKARFHQRTPPAALSSLGARSRMAYNREMTESLGSLADSNYDMVDDVSEVSNDDRETASLTSTDHHASDDEKGFVTEDEDSIIDPTEEHEAVAEMLPHESLVDVRHRDTGPPEMAEEARRDNAVLDSFLSDDMETPRQSTLHERRPDPERFGLPILLYSPSARFAGGSAQTGPSLIRVLLCADSKSNIQQLTHVLELLALKLTGKQGHGKAKSEVLQPPPTPQGDRLSVILVHCADIVIMAQHCIKGRFLQHGAVGSPRKFAMHIQEPESGHVSQFCWEQQDIIAEGSDATVLQSDGYRGVEDRYDITFAGPDAIVFYLDDSPEGTPKWFESIKEARPFCDVPHVHIVDSKTTNRTDAARLTSKYGFDLLDRWELNEPDDGSVHAKVLRLMRLTALQPLEKDDPASTKKSANLTAQASMIKKARYSSLPFLWSLAGVLLLLLGTIISPYPHARVDPAAEFAVRKDALCAALMKLTNLTEVEKAVDVNHLLAQPSNVLSDVHYDGAPPNCIIVAIPKTTRSYPVVSKWAAWRADGQDLLSNLTMLIDGIYAVSIDPREAYGPVTVHMDVTNRFQPFNVTYDFGHRLLQRQTYERATTDLAKAVNKDISLARQSAQSLTHKIGVELSASAAATKNVTTQVAVYVARDLQVFVNTAAAVLAKAAAATNSTTIAIRKDLALAQKDFIILSKDVQLSALSTAQHLKSKMPTMKTLANPFAVSRTRALDLKDILLGRKKDTNSTSATKELSLRLQNFFYPTDKSQRAGSLTDIARCATAKNYLACRKEQRARAALSSQATKSLAKMAPNSVLKPAIQSSVEAVKRETPKKQELKKEKRGRKAQKRAQKKAQR